MAFACFIGIAYSGAEIATARLKGLRVYQADQRSPPVEVKPPASPARHWSRRELAEWLGEHLASAPPTLVGIDHAFSFPQPYFVRYGLPRDWPVFLDDFQHHWPTDAPYLYVDFIRDGLHGHGAARAGNARWRRLTERRAGGATSVFHFDVPGSGAKATHAGLPWLRFLRHRLGDRVHWWPFDGWVCPPGRSVIVEVSPAVWNRSDPRQDRTSDQHDAWSTATRLQEAELNGQLAAWFQPALTVHDRARAAIEGWILGVL